MTCIAFYPGCMAERLKEKLLETDKMVDLVAGPGERHCFVPKTLLHFFHFLDSYRDLPRMLSITETGQSAGTSDAD